MSAEVGIVEKVVVAIVFGASVEATDDAEETGASDEVGATAGAAALEVHEAVRSTKATRHGEMAKKDCDLTALSPPRTVSPQTLTGRSVLTAPRDLSGQPSQPPCMLICMHSTSVRIDAATHQDLKRLAAELNTTVGNTVSLAVRALRQDRIGEDLRAALRDDETAWLDADLG